MAEEKPLRTYTFDLKYLTVGEWMDVNEKASSKIPRDRVALLKLAISFAKGDDDLRDERVEMVDTIIQQFVYAVNQRMNLKDDDV